jgi:sugar lactone lactonase YvrE
MHLIGHSRGGSLVCEISRLLGQQGIWVDQLTTLDPHYVCDTGVGDDGPADVYENVLYADNIYQAVTGSPDCHPFDPEGPSGVFVNGANYRLLTSLSGGYPVDSPIDYSAHLDVHLWYHGTIDTSASASDGTVSFTQAMRNTWYSSDESGGEFAGFYYSRLGGGLTDDNGPYFGLYNEGDFNNSPDNRVALAARSSNEWPSIIQLAHDSTGSVMAGNAFNVKFVFQSYDSGCSVSVYLDPDQNPYDGNQLSLPLTSAINPQPPTARGTRTINTGVTVPSNTPPGFYYICAVVTNPYGTRYLYSVNGILVTANTGGTGNAPTTTSVYPSSLPTSYSTQLINIYGTNFKPTGDPNASTLIFHDPANNPYVRTPIYVSANQLQYNVTVQSAVGTWSVIVTNAGLPASNPQYFSVYTAVANTGSLVVNLSPAGAVSAGAQWQVNGVYYNSGDVASALAPGQYTVSFKSVSSYTTPANQVVTINANAQTTASGTYSVIAPSTYTLTLNQSANGSIDPSPSGWNGSANVYNAGSLVQLYAAANSGYHFTGWSGDVSGINNPITITMNGSENITANFASGDPNMGTVIVTIQPPEAVAAGVTWGFNAIDNDFRASGTGYTTFPQTYLVYLWGTNNWTGGFVGYVTITAGQTTNYTFVSSYTGGQIVGNDPRTYFTLAGSVTNPGFADGVGSAAQFGQPWSPVVDTAGNIFVVDVIFSTIRKITPQGSVSTFAGQAGIQGSMDGVGTNASFSNPYGLAIDSSNNLYVADTANSTIRKITPSGVVSTLAGQAGNYGSLDGTGNAALFGNPRGIAVDTNGNVYVADTSNETIRKITPAGAVTTLAGLVNSFGIADGTGSGARFNFPTALAVDASGNIFVADDQNSAIRKVTPSGVVTTLAGFTGSGGATDGTGNTARFNIPTGVAIDAAGNIYVADNGNNAIRKVTQTGVVATLAGLSGNPGTVDGIGSLVRFHFPSGVAVDASGDLFITDSQNYTIRATQPLTTRINQSIAFPPISEHSAGDAPFTITATASSGLPVYFNVISGPAVSSNNVVTLLGGGTVTLVAWQPGDSNYNAAPTVQQSFTVTKVPQTIAFGPLSQQTAGDAPFPLAATASSGLPVTFTLVSGPASLSGNIVTLTGGGTVTVSASQLGNNVYAAALSISQSFFVVPPPDAVGDGIPDAWRAQYFPNVDPTGTTTNYHSCATCDADGTGQNNLFKYVAGLDPTNPASVFVLQIQDAPSQPTKKTLTYGPIANGCSYVVESTTNLVGGVWTPQAVSAPLTNLNQVTVMDANASSRQKFYRVNIYNIITNIVVQDSVGDSIPDSWRVQYFPLVPPGDGTATNSSSCATCDADGTGQDNFFKYVAGLDPTNPASVFVLNVASGTNEFRAMSLNFNPLVMGRTYTPEFSTNLVSGVWLPLTTYTVPLTNGNQVTITDTNPIPPQEFYRIDISLP